LKAQKETWTSKCSSFLAFSTVADPSIPSIALPHLGEEKYSNMWQKSRSIWKYLATYYLNDFDWFLLGGDDMYFIMENLYDYLLTNDEIIQKQNRKEGIYLGRPFHSYELGNYWYNTGGPGYLLDRNALEVSPGSRFRFLISL
jgi:glycoprotein-N-acetylgalactosamine 3-beta-galactosyltransferase